MRLVAEPIAIKPDRLQRFENLVLPVMGKLHNTAIRLTRNRRDAEDLVQDTYLKAWRYFDRFVIGTNFRAWIFRIMVNNFINRYRKNQLQLRRTNFDVTIQKAANADSPEMSTHGASLPHTNYYDMFDDYVSAALDKLPSQFRVVVLLSDVNELKYKEIAEVLHCPIGTVMSRLSRGRQMLMKALVEYAKVNRYVCYGS